MEKFEIKSVDCHATLAMIEKRWGFPRRTLRALLGMTKSGQSGRSLLPESGADAPAVLSAVYPDSTPAKNRQADVPQYGRSMIEMLGVLAIIGVLSVGGIAGYSKAMQKYRINKTIEQITLIAGNVRAFFAPQKNYNGLSKNVIKKAKLVPDEMLTLNNSGQITAITNPFGGDTLVYGGGLLPSLGYSMFSIEISNINTESCIELSTYDWSSLNVKAIIYEDSTGSSFDYDYQALPVELEDAVSTCSSYDALTFIFKDKDLSSDEWQKIYDCVGDATCWDTD